VGPTRLKGCDSGMNCPSVLFTTLDVVRSRGCEGDLDVGGETVPGGGETVFLLPDEEVPPDGRSLIGCPSNSCPRRPGGLFDP